MIHWVAVLWFRYYKYFDFGVQYTTALPQMKIILKKVLMSQHIVKDLFFDVVWETRVWLIQKFNKRLIPTILLLSETMVLILLFLCPIKEAQNMISTRFFQFCIKRFLSYYHQHVRKHFIYNIYLDGQQFDQDVCSFDYFDEWG